VRWEDEPFIKWYTRFTPEFLVLSIQARGLIPLLCSVVDRAGILKVGGLGLKGVAVSLCCPWKDIAEPIHELVDAGRIVFNAERGELLVPNHEEAQAAKQSDAARKRASRAEARRLFGGSGSASEGARSVTKRDTPSTDRQSSGSLTGVGHHEPMSQNVTLMVTERDHPSGTIATSGRSVTSETELVTQRDQKSRLVPLEEKRREEKRSDPPYPPRGDGGIFGMEAVAFAEGVTRGTGKPCTAPPWRDVRDHLAPAAETHAGGVRGEALLNWFRIKAQSFVTRNDPRFGYTPRRFREWLDGGEVDATAVRKTVGEMQPPAEWKGYPEPEGGAVPMPPEFAAAMTGVGRGGPK
jgi:hypothetical protein